MTVQAPRTWRVLYVEDDRIAALLFEEALRLHPQFEVRVAETAAEALELAAAWYPDVLVIDGYLPDSDAAALLPRLRALPGLSPRIPAVVLSADPADRCMPQCTTSGFAAWWTKPVQQSDLPDALRRVLSAENP